MISGWHRVAHDHEGAPVDQPGGKFLGDAWGHVVAPRVWTLGDFDIVSSTSYVRKVPIVLKKSFSGDERHFLGPLMRFAHGDVRDHIVSPKNGPTFVSALRSVGAVGTAKNQLSRDFRSRSIFD